MPSTPTARNRLEKQAAGENLNTWGAPKLNTVLDLVDASLDGWTTKVLTADYTLTSANYVADEARARVLKFTGTGAFTVTIPSFEKTYYVWNGCSGALTITTGAGETASIAAGELAPVICDASNVKKVKVVSYGADPVSGGTPTAPAHFATKAYTDGLAFAATDLPGQGPGTINQFVKSDGTTASWAALPTNTAQAEAYSTQHLRAANNVQLGGIYSNVTGDIGLVNSSGDSRLKTSSNGQAWLSSDVDPELSHRVITENDATFTNGIYVYGGIRNNIDNTESGTIDLNKSEYFIISISSNTEFIFANPTNSMAQAFAIEMNVLSSANPIFPASVKWPGGIQPTLGNGKHILAFVTFDGGVSWIGLLSGFDVS